MLANDGSARWHRFTPCLQPAEAFATERITALPAYQSGWGCIVELPGHRTREAVPSGRPPQPVRGANADTVVGVEGEDDASAGSSPADASRMGKAAEHLIAAFCIMATRGALNVSTTLVDDEGIDLVFHRRGSTATLAV
ncbi:hypothetical protein [Actinoplanes sp. NBRC 103695]|uniref:hypothetical protein n=1 Tax=Actinoplanes sp. NBRC 103695 TaxID=3032202 RepID=UPI002554FF3C|nr:hypothetical protein [Actinoplanes sp. NBRC 103695]